MKWFSDCPCINSGVMSLAFWPGPPHSLVQKSRTEGTRTIAPMRELLAGSGCNISETVAGCLKEGVCKKKGKREEEEKKSHAGRFAGYCRGRCQGERSSQRGEELARSEG